MTSILIKNYTLLIMSFALICFFGCKTIDSHQTQKKEEQLVQGEKLALYLSSNPHDLVSYERNQTQTTVSIKKLIQKTKKGPKDKQTWLSLAQLSLIRGRFNRAEYACRRVLALDIKDIEAKIILAQIAFRKRNSELTQIILNSLGEKASQDSRTLNMQALIAYENDEMARSVALFKKALAINPNDAAVRMNLGILYLKFHQLKEAAIQFERVLNLIPDHSDAKLHLGIVSTCRGELEQAEAIFNPLFKKYGKNPLVLFNYAVLDKRMGRKDSARDKLKAFLNLRNIEPEKIELARSLLSNL